MKNKIYWKCIVVWLCLTLLVSAVNAAPPQAQTYTVTTQITAGDGWIDTVEPSTAIPAGTTKHYRIQPARGYMIGDVQIDGESIGPMMYATIPNIQANHAISVSFTSFDQIAASNVSTELTDDARILLIGNSTSVTRIRDFLDGQIREDASIDFDVAIGVQAISNDLLSVYYDGRSGGPATRNALLNKIHEGWDYIVPLDLYDYPALLPELHLEGVRLMYNRAWFDGDQGHILLPMVWYSNQSAMYLSEIADHTYRIANGFRIPVLPTGYAWRELVQSHGISESSIEGMSWEAAYLFASMLFAQFFERDVSGVGYSTPYIDNTDRIAIENVAWATWQAEKTKTHYSGAYTGIASPFNGIGGRGYHFGTSTRWRSVDKMNALIAVPDPGVDSLVYDGADNFGDAAVSGSAVQNNLASHTYTYMWRQWKGEDSLTVLNANVRGQFGQDPYFIWFARYYDQSADSQAYMIGYQAFYEASDALSDNLDTVNNPNQRSRAPMTHIGWGRVWEERTDIEMMEPDYLHASGPIMSMIAAQTYALITGHDASLYGAWEYDPSSDLGEKAGYAQRVGYETIMEMSTLDIQEPYNIHQYDVPIFNSDSVFYPQTEPLVVQDDTFVVEASTSLEPFVISAPGVLANDHSTEGKSLTAILSTDLPFGQGEITLNANGSLVYQPALYGSPPEVFTGTATFSYAATDGTNRSRAANVTLDVRLPLRLSKKAEPVDGVLDTEPITYTLTISGAGQSGVLWDPLPSALNYVNGSLEDTLAGQAVYSATARAIVWEGTLPEEGVSGMIRFRVESATPGVGELMPPIVNRAWLTDTLGTSRLGIVIVNGYHTYLPLITRAK